MDSICEFRDSFDDRCDNTCRLTSKYCEEHIKIAGMLKRRRNLGTCVFITNNNSPRCENYSRNNGELCEYHTKFVRNTLVERYNNSYITSSKSEKPEKSDKTRKMPDTVLEDGEIDEHSPKKHKSDISPEIASEIDSFLNKIKEETTNRLKLCEEYESVIGKLHDLDKEIVSLNKRKNELMALLQLPIFPESTPSL